MNFDYSPFMTKLGVKWLSMENGVAELTLRLEPWHMNNWEVTHGGVIMTLLDSVMSRAACSMDSRLVTAVTVEMKTSFFQPAGQTNGEIHVKGRVLHRSTTMFYCEGEIYNGNALAAKAAGTYKAFKRADIARRMKKAG
jgi:uncharacterized protein (TIGR00369 family)